MARTALVTQVALRALVVPAALVSLGIHVTVLLQYLVVSSKEPRHQIHCYCCHPVMGPRAETRAARKANGKYANCNAVCMQVMPSKPNLVANCRVADCLVAICL